MLILHIACVAGATKGKGEGKIGRARKRYTEKICFYTELVTTSKQSKRGERIHYQAYQVLGRHLT